MGTQETIIYRLVVRNQSYDAYHFWTNFGGKMGLAITRDQMDLLGQPRSRNHVFKIFKGEPLLNLS